MKLRFALLTIVCATLSACTITSGSAVLIGKARPPIDPSQVQITRRVPAHYEEIAMVSAKAGHDFRSEQGIMDSAVQRLKKEAAKVGANVVILEGVQNRGAHTTITTIGTSPAYGAGGLAPAATIGITGGSNYGHVTGTAIYVPPGTN